MRAASPHAAVLKRPRGKGLKDSGRHPPGCPAASPSWSAAGAGVPRLSETSRLSVRRQKPPGRAVGVVLLIATGPCRTWPAVPMCQRSEMHALAARAVRLRPSAPVPNKRGMAACCPAGGTRLRRLKPPAQSVEDSWIFAFLVSGSGQALHAAVSAAAPRRHPFRQTTDVLRHCLPATS